MKRLITSIVLLLPFAVGCSSTLSGPDVEQVKRDLVGQTLHIDWGLDYGVYSFAVASVQDMVIQERSTDKDAKTEDLRTLVTVTGSDRGRTKTVRGVVVVRYKHFEQGWKMQSTLAQEGFSVVSRQ